MCRRLLIHLQVDKQDSSEAQLRFGEKQAFLRLRQLEGGLRHETAFGRVAFAVPAEQLPGIQARVQEDKLGSIITELVKLDTPGKATVEVVILGDPVTSMLIILVYFPSKNFFLFKKNYLRTVTRSALLARRASGSFPRSTLRVTSCCGRPWRRTRARSGSQKRASRRRRLDLLYTAKNIRLLLLYSESRERIQIFCMLLTKAKRVIPSQIKYHSGGSTHSRDNTCTTKKDLIFHVCKHHVVCRPFRRWPKSTRHF